MSRITKIIQFGFAAILVVYATIGQAQAQQSSSKDTNPPKEQKKTSGFGDVMLKLGKGLVKEVSRRLNLEETEVVTVKKEVAADGREKYRVETGKFSFTIRKKNKPDTTSRD